MMLLMFSSGLAAQHDPSGLESEPALQWTGNLDAKYALLRFAAESPASRLQFFQQNVPSTASQFRVEPYLNGSYATREVAFQLRMHATYYDDRRSHVDLFEAFARYNPSINTTVQAGKTVYAWGKGYAFNPAGFLNPTKDPENPELAQGGLLSAHLEYVSSFGSGWLQTVSGLLVIVPPTPSLSDRFADAAATDILVKISALAWDTDLDLIILHNPRGPDRVGADISTNLRENLEVHAEIGLTPDEERVVVTPNGDVMKRAGSSDFLAGIRFLSTTNTTLIAEYYKNGDGMDRNEFAEYRTYLVRAAELATPASVQQAVQIIQKYFRVSTLMRNYLYVKVSQPEPFDLLYVTPSAYSLVNLDDGSFLLGAPVSYKPATNIEFILWPTLLTGSSTTEFGSRQVQSRLELWMRVFF